MKHCYIAYEKQHILDFINNVVLAGNDYKKFARDNFAKEEIMLNYPNVAEKICKYFNELFGVN